MSVTEIRRNRRRPKAPLPVNKLGLDQRLSSYELDTDLARLLATADNRKLILMAMDDGPLARELALRLYTNVYGPIAGGFEREIERKDLSSDRSKL